MEKVRLQGYDILIDNEFDNFDPYFDDVNKLNRIFVVTDETVFKLYQNYFIFKTKREVYWHIIKPGDSSKNIESLLKIVDFLFNNNFKRDDILLSLGGGMITDITGLASSLYNRGSNLIHMPTTIIGQVDSSVGGKTGINFDKYKNILGTFYNPQLVLIETNFLKTLPEREILNGMGELIKAGFIGDEKILKMVESKKEVFLDPKIIKRAIEVKSEYVENDYFDHGTRHVLNLGHTFGHAIESASNFELSHGQAVIAGMIKALEVGIKIGVTKEKVLARLKTLLETIEFEIPQFEYSKYQQYLDKDKKSYDQGIKLALLEDIEKPAIVEISWKRLDELASTK